MPTISRFYGIDIKMYFDDKHGPHFHAECAEDEVVVSILDGSILGGHLPNRRLKLVHQWRRLHTVELLENWNRARHSQPFIQIEGLK
ncbi:MAG: DUF4160 domain-containing protein [Chloroflexi bacterium]|nr:DUF4160 domain-containing protein [Chloroflexota bacterium]